MFLCLLFVKDLHGQAHFQSFLCATENDVNHEGSELPVQRPSTSVQQECAGQAARLYSGANVRERSESRPALSNIVPLSHVCLLNTTDVTGPH